MSEDVQPRLLVVGATGYIGARLLAEARARGHEAVGTSSDGREGTLGLDLGRPAGFDLSAWGAGDLALITAAISAPDVCANDRPRAYGVNVTGTDQLVGGLLKRGVRVAFFSSDTVYGEQDQPFDEAAAARPAGDYAAMKHELELRHAGHPGFKALRLSYVFSADDKFTRYLAACARDGKAAEIFDPFDRAVVHRQDVIDGALALARRETWDALPQPVINFGGPATLSRVNYAQILRTEAWPQLRCEVVTPEPAFFTNRPRRIAMRSPLLERLLGRTPRTLAQAAVIEFPASAE